MKKLNSLEIILLLIIAVLSIGIFVAGDTLAEQSPGSPDSLEDSILKETYDNLNDLGYGSEEGSYGGMWNRIISSANWVPNGTVSEDTVVSGYTFYDESRTEKTGTLDFPNYEAQSLQAKDFRDQNGSDSWSSWKKANTNPEVWYDSRTGLYWSASQGSQITNEFTIATCDFFTTTPRGSYNGTDAGCGNAINTCGTLSLDANGDSILETTWYLPTQAELMQAYLDGIYLGTSAEWSTGSNFWSSTENQALTNCAWSTTSHDGNMSYNDKTDNKSVRCVLRDL